MQRLRWRQKALGATLALLVQTIFLSLAILSASRPSNPRVNLAHETLLMLRPLPQPAPTTIDGRGPARPAKSVLPIVVPVVPPSATPSLAPPSGLAGFGQALFGCAPEHYAELTPDQRTHCPKPGEGMTRNDDKDLGSEPRGHAKYEARWQEQWAEDHWVPAPCLPADGGVAQCLLDQSIAENRRALAAQSKIAADEVAAQKAKPPPMPPRPIP
jgi:hypothetical protein